MVEELERLLVEDSTAGRMRAITELKEFRNVALEKLGRKTHPNWGKGTDI